MSFPIIADNKPKQVKLGKGEEYYFCACGRSKKQPFCDGSHEASGMLPIIEVIEEAKKVAWCGCKSSENAPFCDGTHKKFED